ncbi:unnamed protein product [Ophioblennius macclurei]
MERFLKRGLSENQVAFQLSLNRIIDKYSAVHCNNDELEVDLHDENFSSAIPELMQHLKKSKNKLKKLESQNGTEEREESLTAQEMTGDSLLDLTYQDPEADLSVSSVSQLSVNETGMTGADVSQLTTSSADESPERFSQVELQPEDQDEDLQVTLSSNSSLLSDVYPDMISRIKTAMRKQHVCEAASEVLRRYHRFRKKPKRNYLNNTMVIPNMTTREEQLQKETYSSPARTVIRTETSPGTSLWDARPSPGKERSSSSRKAERKPLLAMSLDCPFLNLKAKPISLNKTITVMRASPSKPSASCCVSPRRSAKSATTSPSFHLKAFPSPARSTYVPEITSFNERSDRRSPRVERNPSYERMIADLSRSPHTSYRSPKRDFASRAARSISLSPSLSSLSPKLTVRPAKVFAQTSQQSPRPWPRSPQPAAAGRRLFDSSLQTLPALTSPQQVDEEYKRVFHKYMCQKKWAGSPASPCCGCTHSSRVSGGHSSVLSALALSPHDSFRRKRHREWDGSGHREAKHFRRECSVYPDRPSTSREMLRRCLYPAEPEAHRYSLPSSATRHEGFPRFFAVRPRVHPEAATRLYWTPPAVEASALESDSDQEYAN